MNLLFDLGNTRMKIACVDASGAIALAAIAWDAPDFLAQWQRLALAPPLRIGIASVTREHRLEALRELLAVRFADVPIVVARSHAECDRLRVAYAHPEKLGVDRFLALLAASQQPTAQLLVGVGTALTIDAIDAHGRHHGGLIVPGAGLMRTSITARAPGVYWREGAEVAEFAADTESALESGVWCALAGAVERSARHFATKCQSGIELVLHGGDAAMLSTRLGLPSRQDELLVMRGLAMYLERDVAQSRAATL